MVDNNYTPFQQEEVKEENTEDCKSAKNSITTNEGGMADDRMPYEGGIMDLETARQMYS